LVSSLLSSAAPLLCQDVSSFGLDIRTFGPSIRSSGLSISAGGLALEFMAVSTFVFATLPPVRSKTISLAAGAAAPAAPAADAAGAVLPADAAADVTPHATAGLVLAGVSSSI
jgi:hypothetical protein